MKWQSLTPEQKIYKMNLKYFTILESNEMLKDDKQNNMELLGRLRLEDRMTPGFEASPGNVARPCLLGKREKPIWICQKPQKPAERAPSG